MARYDSHSFVMDIPDLFFSDGSQSVIGERYERFLLLIPNEDPLTPPPFAFRQFVTKVPWKATYFAHLKELYVHFWEAVSHTSNCTNERKII